jgi:hypothetical protein
MCWTRGWADIFSFLWCHSFVWPLAEPFFHPGPHGGAASARSGGQGRLHLWSRPKGLSLTAASTVAGSSASGSAILACAGA